MNLFVPFEKTEINSKFTKRTVRKKIKNITDNTNSLDITKEYKGKVEGDDFKIKTTFGFIYKTQHFHFYLNEKDNGCQIRINSRNNFVLMIIYFSFTFVGLLGLWLNRNNSSIISFVFIFLWLIIEVGITQILWKIIRKKNLERFVDILK